MDLRPVKEMYVSRSTARVRQFLEFEYDGLVLVFPHKYWKSAGCVRALEYYLFRVYASVVVCSDT